MSQVIITLDNDESDNTQHSHKMLSRSLGPRQPEPEIPYSYQFNLKRTIVLDREGLGLTPLPEEEDEEDEENEENEERSIDDRRDDVQTREQPQTEDDEEEDNLIYGGMPNYVVISHQFNCLIIGVERELLFLDITTKKLVNAIPLKSSSTSDVFVEKDGYRGGEALIISYATHSVEKYDMEAVFKNSELNPLWTSGTSKQRDQDSGTGFTDELNYNWPEHLVVCYSNKYDSFFGEDPNEKHGNIIFVCDKWNNRIKVLRSSDGKQLGMFGTKGQSRKPGHVIEFREPWGITLDNQDRILVSEFAGHRIKRLDIQNGQMVVDKTFGTMNDMYNPYGIFYDKIANRLLIAEGECKIAILDLESEKFITPLQNNSFKCPSDACINYKTGELYCTDLYSEKLFIYE